MDAPLISKVKFMMKFNQHDGTPIYLAPEHITCISHEDMNYSKITTVDGFMYTVIGLAEKLAIKIAQEKRR